LNSLLSAAGLLVTSAVAVSACTNILSLDTEFTGAAETLCKCDAFTDPENAFWPDVEGSAGCIEYIQSKLTGDGATDWLAKYDELGCDSCENANSCVSLPPVCIPTGQPCVGSSLTSDASCCGYDPAEPTKSYCGPSNVCAANTPDCKGQLEPCENDLDCCGGDGGLAACLPATEEPGSPKACIALCEVNDPIQCPDCCARVQPKNGDQEFGLCYNAFQGEALMCEDLCTDLGDCGFNSLCAPDDPLAGPYFVYVCQSLTEGE
jgi:hypothetical protein